MNTKTTNEKKKLYKMEVNEKSKFKMFKESEVTKLIRQILSMKIKTTGFNPEELKLYFLVTKELFDEMVKDSSITIEMVKDSSITTEMVKDSSITSLLEKLVKGYLLVEIDLKNWKLSIVQPS